PAVGDRGGGPRPEAEAALTGPVLRRGGVRLRPPLLLAAPGVQAQQPLLALLSGEDEDAVARHHRRRDALADCDLPFLFQALGPFLRAADAAHPAVAVRAAPLRPGAQLLGGLLLRGPLGRAFLLLRRRGGGFFGRRVPRESDRPRAEG